MNKKIFLFGIFCAIFTSLPIEASVIASQPTNLVLESKLIAQNSNNSWDNIDRNNQSRDDFNRVIFWLGLIGTTALVWYWLQSRQGGTLGFNTTAKNADTQLLDRVSPKLRRQLLRQINDPKTVNRLLRGIQQHNPNRSPNWIAEKAIYDFRRGR